MDEGRLEDIIQRFNGISKDSITSKVKKAIDFFYAVDIGGSVIRRYQKRIAERIEWEEKNLTIANATFFGLIPSAAYFAGNYLFGDNISDTFQHVFYSYPSIMLLQSLARISYSQMTKKAIGSISIYNLVGSPIYALEEAAISIRKKVRKPAEGVEPSTPGLQNRCSNH